MFGYEIIGWNVFLVKNFIIDLPRKTLNRLSMKLNNNFGQYKIYFGYFHSCVSIPNATVNGSIIGFNYADAFNAGIDKCLKVILKEYWNNRLDCIRKNLSRVPRKRLLDKRGFKRLLAKNKQGKHIGKQSVQDFKERFANAARIPKRYL